MNLTTKMQRAMEKTVYAYEKAIIDLEDGVSAEEITSQWRRYGTVQGCRLCNAAHNLRFCQTCALGPRNGGCHYIDKGYSLAELRNAIRGDASKDDLVLLFKARLKDINKRFDENGWEVV